MARHKKDSRASLTHDSLYPLGKFVRGALVSHHLSSSIFEKLQIVLETEPRHPIIKLDYLKRTPGARHGRLIVTIRHDLANRFSQFAPDIAEQMRVAALLPASVLSSENLWPFTNNWVKLKHRGRERYVEAHGSLSLYHYDNEFLIVDCTFAKPSRDTESKAQDYIFGARRPLNFAVFIHIDTISEPTTSDRKTTPNIPVTAITAETQEQQPWHPDHKRLLPSDRVTVTVYQGVVKTTESGKLVRVMSTVVDNVEVWPAPATDKDFFTIKWSDMNWTPWEDFVAERELAPSPEPTWRISLSGLSKIAQNAARVPRPHTARRSKKVRRCRRFSSESPDLDHELAYPDTRGLESMDDTPGVCPQSP